MKTKLFVLVSMLVLTTSSLRAQGTFANVGFESGAIVLDTASIYYPHAAYADSALPNWTASVNGNQQSTIFYNDVSLGAPAVSIHDASSSLQPLHGNYSVLLQGSSGGASASATLSQTGLIPGDALSLRFRAWGSSFQVSLNGQTLNLIPLANAGNYTVYGADISSFAGNLTELRFTALPTGNLFFDAVQFSTAAVPEPSTFALVGVGLLGFLFLRWSARAGP